MEWIGHYEFGRAFRPFAFPGEAHGRVGEPEYWLDYWDRGFRHILADLPDQSVVIDYDRLCEAPQAGLRALADLLGVPAQQFDDEVHRFRPANHYDALPAGALAVRAQETHALLRWRAAELR